MVLPKSVDSLVLLLHDFMYTSVTSRFSSNHPIKKHVRQNVRYLMKYTYNYKIIPQEM